MEEAKNGFVGKGEVVGQDPFQVADGVDSLHFSAELVYDLLRVSKIQLLENWEDLQYIIFNNY